MAENKRERVTGIGGVFYKAADPAATREWYRQHLGIEPMWDWGTRFAWREQDNPERTGYTVWSPMARDTTYFNPSQSQFMINFRVKDLHAMLDQLRAAGVEIDDKTEESEFGKFGWFMDPDGVRIELWEPPEKDPEE